MSELSYPELREQLVQAARRLAESDVLSHSGHGNMSGQSSRASGPASSKAE